MDTPTDLVRERILGEAAQLFVSHGYDGISMREIAAACSLSKAGIYYHFKDKEDLFLALMMDSLERVGRLVAEVGATGGTQRARIEAFARGLFTRLSPTQRAVIRLANQEMGKLSGDIRAGFNRDYHRLFIEPLRELFAAGMESGELRRLDPAVSTWILLGMLYPLLAPSSESGLDAADTALEIFFEGLSKR